ncbi:MAG: hypothetical protein WA783_15240 [Phormidesmis sp.]
MVDPINLATIAGLGIKGLSEGVVQLIGKKETQKTIRMQHKLGAAADAGACLQALIVAYQDHQVVVSQERSKRRDIAAQEKVTLSRIRSQRDIFLTFLDKSFDEREKNFTKLFDVLDKAMTSGDNQKVAIVLNQIAELARSSPFKDLQNASKVQAALDDPEHEWAF